MKKYMMMALAVALFTACEKADIPDNSSEEPISVVDGKTKKFTFTVKGDFGTPTFTRGYLQSDGKDMTDLWVFDYMGGAMVQQLHQSNDDDDFGTPTMNLAYGAHHIYFVASRGASPTLTTESHMITWGTVRDTFYKDYEVNVVSTSNGNRAVTLDRVATKMTVTITDEVPTGCASLAITPSLWYYGLDYVDGSAVSGQEKAVTVSVPNSYVGTSGELAVSLYGIGKATEYTTDIAIVAKDGESAVIGSATIEDAPFKRNRGTEYSGYMFGSGGALACTLNTTWLDAETLTW